MEKKTGAATHDSTREPVRKEKGPFKIPHVRNYTGTVNVSGSRNVVCIVRSALAKIIEDSM